MMYVTEVARNIDGIFYTQADIFCMRLHDCANGGDCNTLAIGG